MLSQGGRDGDQHHEQGDNDADEEAKAPPEEPNTLAAFKLLKESYDNTEDLIAECLRSHWHHLRMRVLILCGECLHMEYNKGLEAHKDGYQAMLRFQALRSYGAWYQTVHRLLDLFEDARVLQSLDMRSHMPDQEPSSSADPSMKQDAQTAQSLYDLVVQLASARCWSQLHYTLCVPHCFVQVFLPHPDHMQDVQAFLQKVGVKLGKVEEARKRIAGRGPEAKLIEELVTDLATLDWVVVRELLIDSAQTGYDPRNPRLREVVFSIFAGSAETKSLCENAFAHLRDSVGRQSKRNILSDDTKLMYLISSPYAEAGGSTPLRPTPDDIRLQSASDNQDFEDLKVFSGVFHKLPLSNVTPLAIKKWRPAGYHSQRLSAAAMAFVLKHVHRNRGVDMEALGNAWASA